MRPRRPYAASVLRRVLLALVRSAWTPAVLAVFRMSEWCGHPLTNAPGTLVCERPKGHGGHHSSSGRHHGTPGCEVWWAATRDRRGAARTTILNEWRYLTAEDRADVLTTLTEKAA